MGFDPKFIRFFIKNEKKILIHLITLSNVEKSTGIYELSDIFYVKIKINSYKSSGPAQCYSCQRFGLSSLQCGHPSWYEKCGGAYQARDCSKPREDKPICCNYSG